MLVPKWRSWNVPATVISVAAVVAMFTLRWSMLRTLGAAVVLGLVAHYLAA